MPTYYSVGFSRKLHENEENWAERGECASKICQCRFVTEMRTCKAYLCYNRGFRIPQTWGANNKGGKGAGRCRPIIFPQNFSENFMKVRKIKKVSMVLLFKIETCNENWTQLSLGQSSSWTSCQPSWMATITKYYKNGYHGCSTVQERNLQCKPNSQTGLGFGSILNLNMLSIIFGDSHYKKSRNGYHGSSVKDRDLWWKPTPLSLGQSITWT